MREEEKIGDGADYFFSYHDCQNMCALSLKKHMRVTGPRQREVGGHESKGGEAAEDPDVGGKGRDETQMSLWQGCVA